MNRRIDFRRVLFTVMVLVSLTVGIAAATPVTQNITYQGKLTDVAGNPLTGTYSVTFKLYEVSSGGTALATDTHTVQASKGLFTTQITADQIFFDGRALWLGIKVGADAEMTPRQELRPVPYALSLRPGAVIISTDFSSALNLQNKGGGLALNVSTSSNGGTAVYASTQGQECDGVFATTANDSSFGFHAITHGYNSVGVVAATVGNNSPGVFASTSRQYSPGVSAATSGQYSPGVSVLTYGPDSYGVYGESKQDRGVYGKGVWGGFFETNKAGSGGFIPNGIGVNTAYDNNRGIIVTTTGTNSPGITSQTSKDGSNGVRSTTEGADSHGVYASTIGPGSNAIVGETSADGPAAVAGLAHGTGSWGVYAVSDKSNGLYAHTARSDQKYGIYTPDYLYAKGTQVPAADVAEYMPVTGKVAPGTVLVIGKGGILKPSVIAYDTHVAGIVSTAPGVSLGTKEDGNSGEALIAVAGKVPCNVDASSGSIEEGDLLTTSSNPGYAMKATNPQIGTVLGKAMGSLETGTGTIEVLVTLQ